MAPKSQDGSELPDAAPDDIDLVIKNMEDKRAGPVEGADALERLLVGKGWMTDEFINGGAWVSTIRTETIMAGVAGMSWN